MRRFFTFWWRCAREAFWGNSAFANDWQWVIGNPLASAVGGVLATIFGAAAVTTGSNIFDAFLAALLAFVITWIVAYLIRLFSLPAEYFYREKARADGLENVDGRQQAKTKLWELRSEGVAIRNKGKKIAEEARVAEWTTRFKTWHAAVLETAMIYSPDLRHSLEPVDKIAVENQETVRGAHVKNHQLNVSLMSEVLSRLYKFLNREY